MVENDTFGTHKLYRTCMTLALKEFKKKKTPNSASPILKMAKFKIYTIEMEPSKL